MKKIILALLVLSVFVPQTTFAYSYSSSARSFSAPSRSFSSSRSYSSYSPSRSYTPTVRTIPTPVRTVSTPVNTVSTPITPAKPIANGATGNFRSMGVAEVASPAVSRSGTSFNPFSSNFFLWYMIFGGMNSHNNVIKNSTTTNATK